MYICNVLKNKLVFDIFEIENRELTQTALSTVLKTAGTFGYGGRHLNSLQLGKLTAIFILYFVMVEKKDKCFPFSGSSYNGYYVRFAFSSSQFDSVWVHSSRRRDVPNNGL